MDLPDDVLKLVFGHLGPKTLARVACVNRRFRDLSDATTGLDLYLAPKSAAAIHQFQRLGPRVTSLTMRRLARTDDDIDLRALTRLQRLDLCFARAGVKLLRTAPKSLRDIYVHMLHPSSGGSDVFYLSRMLHLPALQSLVLYFSTAWTLVVVDALDHDLDFLQLRCAPAIIVRSPPPRARHLTLHAADGILTSGPLDGCEQLTIACDSTPVAADVLLGGDQTRLRHLALLWPGRMPRLDWARLRIEALTLFFDSMYLADLWECASLRRVVATARRSVSGLGGIPEGVSASVMLGDMRLH